MSLSPCHWPIPSATAMRAYCAGLVGLDTAVTASVPPSHGNALATTIFALALVLCCAFSPPAPPGAMEPPAWLMVVVFGVWACLAVKRWHDYLRDRAAYRAAVQAVTDALTHDASARPT